MNIRTMWTAVVLCLFTAGVASAQVVSFNVTTSVASGRPLNALQENDLITLDIRVSKADTTTSIFGIGGAVQGYNPAIVEFVSGEIYFFDDDSDPETPELQTAFFRLTATAVGLDNLMPSGSLSVNNSVPGFGPYVQFVNAAGVTGRRGNGSFDIGIDGTPASPEARIVFRVIDNVTSGSTSFNIGTTTNATVGNVVVLTGGVPTQANNATVNITVPEPGAVLAGMAAIGTTLAGVALRRRFSI